ncbi:AraC family transcriptional regulator [Achromobacter insolitus]|uniref:AraC family transcriptional regulator n=1 Tax=Achromobacter insolitus TaxID=217204 RepID=UPI001AA0854A|nr:AraC family transcriptional regulator [Achromobacter insolitus]MDQ6211693.1 AraC family transcriptional regulator [Achromobacter insolitus]
MFLYDFAHFRLPKTVNAFAQSSESWTAATDQYRHAGVADALLQAAQRYADANVNREGVAAMPVEGVAILRETSPSALQYAITKPLVALVLQGRKRVTMGAETFEFSAGESLLITTDVPTVSQITAASSAAPYYSLVMELDAGVITDLVGEMGSASTEQNRAVCVDPTETEVADAALRLLRLLDRPASVAVLGRQLIRELHYWLLVGRQGSAIRALGVNGSHTNRIARAIAVLRKRFAEPLPVETLAKAASMSLSAFHTHFRSVTTLTPLQFQKQLRLLEARRRLLAEGAAISTAAYAVGYESVTQFTREYARMFGQPPGRSIREARAQAHPPMPNSADEVRVTQGPEVRLPSPES